MLDGSPLYALCRKLTALQKLYTLESAHSNEDLTLASFWDKWRWGVLATLPKAPQRELLSFSSLCACGGFPTGIWYVFVFCFPDSEVRSFRLPNIAIVLTWSELKKINTSMEKSGKFHWVVNLFIVISCVSLFSPFFILFFSPNEPAITSLEERLWFLMWSSFTYRLANWSLYCMQTWKLFDPCLKKDMSNGRNGIIRIVHLKNGLRLKTVLFLTKNWQKHETHENCSPHLFIFTPFISGRRKRSGWTLY